MIRKKANIKWVLRHIYWNKVINFHKLIGYSNKEMSLKVSLSDDNQEQKHVRPSEGEIWTKSEKNDQSISFYSQQ